MSAALQRWVGESRGALDEIEAAHRAVEGRRGRRARPGRRYATLRVNHAYAVLLAGHFQAFCRDLHTEAADWLAANFQPQHVGEVLGKLLTLDRQLDKWNANPGTIGADFGRFVPGRFWPEIDALDGRGPGRRAKLEELNTWRNAIAHQDWSKVGGTDRLQLAKVRTWRSACGAMALQFDLVLKGRLHAMVGRDPW